ncbi:MAG: glycosyltransferase [Capsulimonadaceae bacterium]
MPERSNQVVLDESLVGDALPRSPSSRLTSQRLYSVVVLLCLAAALVRAVLHRVVGYEAPFGVSMIAVVIAGRLGGFKAGAVATAICTVLSDYLFAQPSSQPGLSHEQVIRASFFIVVSLGVSAVNEGWRSAEQRALDGEENLGRILQTITDGVIVVTTNGTIRFANRRAARIFGMLSSHMVGRNCNDPSFRVRPVDTSSDESLPFEVVARTGKPIFNREFMFVSPAGNFSNLTVNAAPLYRQSEKAVGIVFTIRQSETQDDPFDSSFGSDTVTLPLSFIDPSPVRSDGPIPVLYLDHTARISGGEIALVRLLEAIDRNQYMPVVLLAEAGPLEERLKQIGVSVHVIPLSGSVREVKKDSLGVGALTRMDALLPFLRYCFTVARFARQHNTQLIHTNSLKADLYGGMAGILCRRPVVWHVRDHIDPSYLPSPAVQAFRFLAKWMPTYVITNSESTQKSLFLGAAQRSSVIPSGLDIRDSVIHDGLTRTDLARGPAFANPARTWPDIPRIGIIGRIASWKGQHIFIEAAAQVLLAGYKAKFLIVGAALFGESDYEATIRQRVVDLGLQADIEFVGFCDHVPAFLKTLDVLVHASITPEPFGQVIIEGMAEGLPVIGTNGGGVREIIINRENGLLVPMGDAAAMAEAIQYLLDSPEDAGRIARAGYLNVRRNFTARQSASSVERVYAEMLSANVVRAT